MTSTTIAGKKGMRNAIAGFALAGALAIPGIALAAPSSATYCKTGNGGDIKGCTQTTQVGAQNGTGAASGAFGVYSHTGPPATPPANIIQGTCPGTCTPTTPGAQNPLSTGGRNSSIAGVGPNGIDQPTPRNH